ncbi:methyltransferase family protein [Longimicrobium terrae]|uniref:Protein-S-isoprenylcysteine O-methyltransferase Ste14 n=1 Tax=Longimicrobium terrae TaxID=1639882 RepID=A0A841H353_9BACT|nr:isoprenylcysteine carboxylmethyltransferase family protein [Longimicrobium terrae]MBB4637876.1 protein-S-isoprenylcysteine O-methyltransferase Ste14 [Longimicrobium terrae]MBB6072269.1 protein-S-isoprenylcysteine O-methyltransferase Ste14 [Longimicrobium terrae]NNC31191.1 isoprenylcysteine carboxylmethyltransferase family protein [Longimicrobium terrae]
MSSSLPITPAADPVPRAVAGFFAVQGASVALWWPILYLVPRARELFRMSPGPDDVLLSFMLPDLAVLAPASLLGALLLARRDDRAAAILWCAAGAILYAVLFCLAFALRTDAGWLGVALMLPCALLSASCAAAVTPGFLGMLRPARPAPAGWNTAKTFAQMAVFWGVLLFLVPALIQSLQDRVGVPSFAAPGLRVIAAILFAACGGVGVWSAVVMAREGRGTPLPLDAPREMVVTGPYAFVRNPMAMSSLGQGAAVALYLGSPLVFVYVAIGAWMWQYLARPVEEHDLLRTFGAQYEAYRSAVRCWLPNAHRYSIDPLTDQQAGRVCPPTPYEA